MKREQTQVLRKSKQFLPITMLVVRTKPKLGDVYVVYTSIIGIELELLTGLKIENMYILENIKSC
jgi:hypothetical protein